LDKATRANEQREFLDASLRQKEGETAGKKTPNAVPSKRQESKKRESSGQGVFRALGMAGGVGETTNRPRGEPGGGLGAPRGCRRDPEDCQEHPNGGSDIGSTQKKKKLPRSGRKNFPRKDICLKKKKNKRNRAQTPGEKKKSGERKKNLGDNVGGLESNLHDKLPLTKTKGGTVKLAHVSKRKRPHDKSTVGLV